MPEETKVIEQPNSCKIAVNAKGQFSGEVKVYSVTSLLACSEAKVRAEEIAEFIKSTNG